jgi:hypothetical protein
VVVALVTLVGDHKQLEDLQDLILLVTELLVQEVISYFNKLTEYIFISISTNTTM